MEDNRSRANLIGAFEAIEGDVGDLSSWEFINASDDDEEDRFSYSSEDLEVEESKDPIPFGSPSSDISMESLSDQLQHCHQITKALDVDDDAVIDESNGGECFDEDEDGDEDDDGFDGDEYDEYDDELVPRWASDKFGKQRMKKLGKRVNPKMNNSRKVPCYYYNRVWA
ncbi:unnamed protein product [Ilex paraguariensis]|uniref:Uncharacterized protein n=1 Tax=Ilex paraguariensis TaxID=185542 RepID=A0ABC8R6T9_9AQUA